MKPPATLLIALLVLAGCPLLPAQSFWPGYFAMKLTAMPWPSQPKQTPYRLRLCFSLPAGKYALLMHCPDDRWMLNVEPGCFAAYVRHEKTSLSTHRFSLLDGGGSVEYMKKALSIQADHFEFQCEDALFPGSCRVSRVIEIAAAQNSNPPQKPN